MTKAFPATMAETLLPREEEGIHSWSPWPQQALNVIPSGRLKLALSTNLLKCLLPVKDSQPSRGWGWGFLEESAAVDPRDQVYDLGWGERALPIKQEWVSYPEEGCEE